MKNEQIILSRRVQPLLEIIQLHINYDSYNKFINDISNIKSFDELSDKSKSIINFAEKDKKVIIDIDG